MRQISRFFAGLLIALPVVLLAGPQIASAYVLEGQRWCDNTADISAHTCCGTSSFVLNKNYVMLAADDWTNHWDGSGTTNFTYTWDADNVNARINLWSSYSGTNGTLAYTSYGYNPFNNCMNSGTSIMWNLAYGFDYNGPCDYSTTWYPMQGVSAHELGHALGMAHSNDSGAIMWATFQPCYAKDFQSLDDYWGQQAIYGYR